jgi:hypothetical protein
MRTLEQKQNVAKARMKKLSEIRPKVNDEVEKIMKKDAKEIIDELIVPVLAKHIAETKALRKRVGLLEKMVVALVFVVIGVAACAAFL